LENELKDVRMLGKIESPKEEVSNFIMKDILKPAMKKVVE